MLSSTEVKYYWVLYAEEKIKITSPETIQGVTASIGGGKKIIGKVRILLNPYDRFKKGDILVTTMTSPEYVFAMRNALAIITDYGGIGSHAAIVSRELGKPCIVNTKIATKVLKDGDIIEVDINSSSIKKLHS